METLLFAVIAVLWALLLAFGAFIVKRLFGQLDGLSQAVRDISITVAKLETIVKGE